MVSRVVVITGTNRGIGRTVVERLLAESPQYTVIMTARSPEQGSKAYNEILQRGDYASRLLFHPLDIRSTQSISAFANHISTTVRQIDILVNNAGIARKGQELNEEVARDTLSTNFLSTVELTQAFLPLLTPRGHVICVSSTYGQLIQIPGIDLRARLSSETLTTGGVLALGQELIQSVRDNTYEQQGWPPNCYVASKNLLNAYARAFNRELRSTGSTLRVNAVDPGWVRTDMGGPKAPLSLEEGAETPLAVIRYEGDESGNFWQRSQISTW